MKAYILENGIELGNDISLATSIPARMKGLLGKKRLETGKGLLIRPCKGIHTFFMKFAIDVIFLDKDSRIIALHRDIGPNNMTPIYRKAVCALELTSGSLHQTVCKGNIVVFS